MLQVGQTAPQFSLPDADMKMVSLKEFKGKSHVIVFFYPKDNTPGCTLEATSFSDHEDDFARYNYTILGINRDDCLKHADFRDKHGISINLLSDADGVICKKYGVLQNKEVDGVKKLSIVRSTFIIDKEGILRFVQYGVTPKGHVQEMLSVVKEMNL